MKSRPHRKVHRHVYVTKRCLEDFELVELRRPALELELLLQLVQLQLKRLLAEDDVALGLLVPHEVLEALPDFRVDAARCLHTFG